MKQRESIINSIFVGLIALGIFISAITLYTQSIRLDESQSLWFSTKSVTGVLSVISQDVHVPLYNLLLHFWIQLFGTDIVKARTLSFIFFLLTLPVLYKIAVEAGSRRLALLTVTLFTLSPFIMWYSNEARMYTLFTFSTSLNHLYFLRLLRSEGKKDKLGYFLSTILGLYSHYFFLFLLFTQFLYMIFSTYRYYHLRSIRSRLKQLAVPIKPPLWKYIGLLAIASIFFIPWVGYVLLHGGAANTQPLIPAPTSFNIFQSFVNFVFGFQGQLIQSVLISLWPLLVLMFFFVFTRRRQYPLSDVVYFGFVTFLPIIIVFAISFIRPIFLTRYLILVTPTLFIIIAWMLLSNSKRLSILLISLFIASQLLLSIYQNTSFNTPVREDYQGVSMYLEQHAGPRDIIAVSAPFTIYPIEFTYSGIDPIVTIPLWDNYNQGAIPPFSVSNLAQQVKTYQSQYQDLFVVLSYDQGYEDKIKQYLDTHYKRKVRKVFSPGLEVREYVLRYPATTGQ